MWLLGNQRSNLHRQERVLADKCGLFLRRWCMIHDELLFTIILSLSGVQFIGGRAAPRSLLASLFWRVSTKPALQRTQDTSPVSKGNRFLQCLSLSPVRPGPGRLCFHGRAGPGLTAQSAQAIIRLFQGYAVIMEWAAYRDSRKADWELIGRGKTSRKRCSVPAYLFNLSKWLER